MPLDPHDLPRLEPYKQILKTATDTYSEDVRRFAALLLRESEAGQASGYHPPGDPCGWGDAGNAYGLFQIDKRYHSDFIASGAAKDPQQQAFYACSLLAQNRQLLKQYGFGNHPLFERAVYDLYNAAPHGVIEELQAVNGNPDLPTTGGDYASWIFSKAEAIPEYFFS